MPVRGVRNKIIYIDEYTYIKIYVKGTIKGRLAKGVITLEVYLVDNLKVNLLVRNNIIKSQGIIINFSQETINIRAYRDLTVPINIHARNLPYLKRTINAKLLVIIPLDTIIKVPIIYKGEVVPTNRDYLFKPEYTYNLRLEGCIFAYIVDTNI